MVSNQVVVRNPRTEQLTPTRQGHSAAEESKNDGQRVSHKNYLESSDRQENHGSDQHGGWVNPLLDSMNKRPSSFSYLGTGIGNTHEGLRP